MLTGAWNDVSKGTIKNCCPKGGLVEEGEVAAVESLENLDDENCDGGIHTVWAELSQYPAIICDGLMTQEFVTVDNDVDINAELNSQKHSRMSDSEVKVIPI